MSLAEQVNRGAGCERGRRRRAENRDVEIISEGVYTTIMKTMSGKKSGKQSKSADPIQAAINYGIDISMLKDNVKRTPAELIRRHQIALETAEKLRKAKGL